MVRIVYSDKALKNLSALDRQISKRIVRKIEKYGEMTDPLSYAKALVGSLSGMYRYRIGDYRVLFEVDSSGTVTILLILTIKHRKDVYK